MVRRERQRRWKTVARFIVYLRSLNCVEPAHKSWVSRVIKIKSFLLSLCFQELRNAHWKCLVLVCVSDPYPGRLSLSVFQIPGTSIQFMKNSQPSSLGWRTANIILTSKQPALALSGIVTEAQHQANINIVTRQRHCSNPALKLYLFSNRKLRDICY